MSAPLLTYDAEKFAVPNRPIGFWWSYRYDSSLYRRQIDTIRRRPTSEVSRTQHAQSSRRRRGGFIAATSVSASVSRACLTAAAAAAAARVLTSVSLCLLIKPLSAPKKKLSERTSLSFRIMNNILREYGILNQYVTVGLAAASRNCSCQRGLFSPILRQVSATADRLTDPRDEPPHAHGVVHKGGRSVW